MPPGSFRQWQRRRSGDGGSWPRPRLLPTAHWTCCPAVLASPVAEGAVRPVARPWQVLSWHRITCVQGSAAVGSGTRRAPRNAGSGSTPRVARFQTPLVRRHCRAPDMRCVRQRTDGELPGTETGARSCCPARDGTRRHMGCHESAHAGRCPPPPDTPFRRACHALSGGAFPVVP
jgi:hypothetical protein